MAKKSLTKKEAGDFFDKLDKNDDGKCTIVEIKRGLQSYCSSVYGGKSDQYFVELVSDWDQDNDSMVSRDEFVNDMTKKNRDEGIEEAFKVMDADGSGKISKAEFKKCMIDNGITDQATIDELLSKADCDGDGQLSISELRTAVQESQQ